MVELMEAPDTAEDTSPITEAEPLLNARHVVKDIEAGLAAVRSAIKQLEAARENGEGLPELRQTLDCLYIASTAGHLAWTQIYKLAY